jgi:hypothetical protein
VCVNNVFILFTAERLISERLGRLILFFLDLFSFFPHLVGNLLSKRPLDTHSCALFFLPFSELWKAGRMQLRILVCIMTLCVGYCECFALVSPLRCGNIRTTLHRTSECAGLRLSLEDDMNAGKRRAQPRVDRAQAIRTAAAAVLGGTGGAKIGRALPLVMRSGPAAPRSVASIDSWTALPVWPVWPTPDSPTGGRVRPISPNPVAADPFLLLAHHRHSFSPWDPLRAPFKAVGGALGLPYVGDEGFAIHPHRGIDIWTIVLDGSDGFKHKDSLGIYKNIMCII